MVGNSHCYFELVGKLDFDELYTHYICFELIMNLIKIRCNLMF